MSNFLNSLNPADELIRQLDEVIDATGPKPVNAAISQDTARHFMAELAALEPQDLKVFKSVYADFHYEDLVRFRANISKISRSLYHTVEFNMQAMEARAQARAKEREREAQKKKETDGA